MLNQLTDWYREEKKRASNARDCAPLVSAARACHSVGKGHIAADLPRFYETPFRFFPPRWQQRVLTAFMAKMGRATSTAAEADAWHETQQLLDRLSSTTAPLDATDADICDLAERCVAHCVRVIGRSLHEIAAGEVPAELREIVQRRGINMPRSRCDSVAPIIARLQCRHWWRRQLRRQHAMAVEGAAIQLGYVSLRGERYCSDETLRRRLQQNSRNQRTLESTTLENENGQRYTLAQLAALSVSNKAIRRGELITRLRGFEEIANELGHVAEAITITCPSRMHAMTRDGQRNGKYANILAPEANRYLGRVWARIRAKLAREKIPVYGLRVVEPHGNGTPHWHFVLCVPDEAARQKLRAIVQHYALADSPDEPGAAQHRVDFKTIERARGSMVGYFLKYIAKNIDGFQVGDWVIDQETVDDKSVNLSPRIEAWSANWSMRQFAQIGGPAVGLWREMRRIKSDALVGAPQCVQDAWLAAQRIEIKHEVKKSDADLVDPDKQNRTVRADFAEFIRATGGVFCKRLDRPVWLQMAIHPGLNRYGEPAAPKPVGVGAAGEAITDIQSVNVMGQTMVAAYRDDLQVLVKSVRHVWRVVRSSMAGMSLVGTRTRVNNCTRPVGVEATAPGKNARVPRAPPASFEPAY